MFLGLKLLRVSLGNVLLVISSVF